MTDIAFSENAWGEYLVWQSGDRKTLRRINKLIADMQRHPDTGLGKPERLKGDLAGCYSRRNDWEHRLVYRVNGDTIEILQCRGYYVD
ncbi:addiction module toxin, Txe/YoeB family [Mobiluncus mulieris 28-1]|uniref:Txe/YoeB family addiction module toxin n=1 Tax=Mobiluncus mulieris TaxID=2052 RepID=UPI0001BE7BCB|nr:Txe/YoeB family addiction module toxin [Mobiluncus mulieris]EEZ91576.1 addiction module toxin, Txe/YoeB family [Mobiluncus mulieris 28-1]